MAPQPRYGSLTEVVVRCGPPCLKANRLGARFCCACGAALATQGPRRERPAMPQAAARPVRLPVAEGPHCPHCRGRIRPAARFCGHCGEALVSPAARAAPVSSQVRAAVVGRPVRPPDVVAHAQALGQTRATPLDLGANAILVGGALAFVGCLLPLAQAGGQGLRLVPDVMSRVGGAAFIPLACLVLAGLGLAVSRADDRSRIVMAGVGIGLSSPGAVLTLLFLRAAAWVGSSLNWIGLDARPAGGAALLLLGFVAALTGAFIVLCRRPAPGEEGARP